MKRVTRRDEYGIWRSAGTSHRPPRKVLVGTMTAGFYGRYPGLAVRLKELTYDIGEMDAAAHRRYGRGLDLAVLPEFSVTGEAGSNKFEGPVQEAFAEAARRYHCYLVLGMNLVEDAERDLRSNAAILMDRKGKRVGFFRKMHPVPSPPGRRVLLEGGVMPGLQAPVFQCDFGRLGFQICYDVEFTEGWNELAEKNAELVAWPTQSPQIARPAAHALRHGYYIVSSTWKRNASIFDPMGRVAAQVRPPGRILVHEIDLSWALLGWAPTLKGGALLKRRYGRRIGFRYHDEEDRGLFWSNDPRVPIGRMARAAGLVEWPMDYARSKRIFRAARQRR